MDILSKGGFSVPLILGCILEIVSLENFAYTPSQDPNPDLISTAAASLSSATTPASDNTSTASKPDSNEKAPHSDTAQAASNALGRAVSDTKQSKASYEQVPVSKNPNQEKTVYTPEELHKKIVQQKHATTTAVTVDDNKPPKKQMVKRLQPNPGNPRFLAPMFVDHVVNETKRLSGYIQVGGQNYKVTNNQGDWSGAYLLGVFQTDDKNTWAVGIDHDNRFFQTGNYGQLSNTHIINDDWYSSVSIGISDTSNLVPKYFLGGTINKKQGPKKQIIGYLGAHSYWWRGGHTTEDINPGFIYYFEKPWVLEAGAYISRGNPGAVYASSGYAALTQGRDKEHYYTVRFGFGKEAYLPIDIGNIETATIVGYPSYVIGGTWRQWIGKNWGFNLASEFYHNPFYNRYGSTYGIFWEFG